eukprot:3935426-Rhodomonas_salina.2
MLLLGLGSTECRVSPTGACADRAAAQTHSLRTVRSDIDIAVPRREISPRSAQVASLAIGPPAMCGTDTAFGATRCAALTQCMAAVKALRFLVAIVVTTLFSSIMKW